MHNPPADVRIHVTDHDIAIAREALAWADVVGAPAERLEELAADHARLVQARAARLTEICQASRSRGPMRHDRAPH